MPQQVRLAPLLIHAGAGTGGSDVLAVATGASGLGETAMAVQLGSSTASDLRVNSTVGLRGNDLVLVAEDGMGCMVQQVDGAFAGGADQLLSFGGTYAKAEIDSLQLASFGVANPAFVSLLGNTSGNRPAMQLFGVGANATLFGYDLLRLDGTDAAQPVADGVADLRARYGVDTNNDGVVDAWVAPTDANFTAAALTAGTLVAQQRADEHHGRAHRPGAALRPHRTRGRRTGIASTLFPTCRPPAAHAQHRCRRPPTTLSRRGIHGAAAQRDARSALMKPAHRSPATRRAQRGAVLLFALIALVVLLIGTVALMRSMNTSLFTAGNFGFKRDSDQPGRARHGPVLDTVQSGALANRGGARGRCHSQQLQRVDPADQRRGPAAGTAVGRGLRRRRRGQQRHLGRRHGRDGALRDRPAVRADRAGVGRRMHGRQRTAAGRERGQPHSRTRRCSLSIA